MLRAMRILTGLQPSGKLHVGNYFGAMQPAVQLQDEGEAFYFIADYHAMTSSQDPTALRENIRELAVDFLACGLDPARAVFFRQSAVPEVNELAWILSTVCPMSLLAKCHSYKDKTAQGIAPHHALFAYPVLMAADILLYDSNDFHMTSDVSGYCWGACVRRVARSPGRGASVGLSRCSTNTPLTPLRTSARMAFP